MSDSYLRFFNTILDQIARGAPEVEVTGSLNDMTVLAKVENMSHDAELLRRQLEQLAKTIQNSGLAERGLNLLIDTTHDLSSTLSLADLFRIIVSRARSLVGANIAWLTLLDEEAGLFKTTTAEGHLLPETAEMSSRIEYGVVNRVMSAKTSFETQDYLNDPRFNHSPGLDRVFKNEGIVSLAGFPVIFEDKVQGLLFVADRYHRELSAQEVSVLGSFAQHAGVAMRNARTFAQLTDALAEGESNRSVLVEQIQRVENSAQEHDEMTSLLANGADLRTFIQRMANNISGAVFLADENMKIKEQYFCPLYDGKYAHDFTRGKIPPSVLIPAIRKSRQNGRSVSLFDAASEHCLVISLHDGTRHGESLVICYEGTRDPIDIRNLERSAVALSIAKLWNDKRESEKLIDSATLLRHLLFVKSPDSSTTSSIRERLNLRVGQPVMLAIIAVSGFDRAAQTAMVRGAANRLDILVDLIDDTYVAIGPKDQIDRMVRNFSKQPEGWKIGGIISDEFAKMSQSAFEYERLERALKVLSQMTRLSRFLKQSEVNLFAKIFEVGDAERISDYIATKLAPIETRAANKSTRLKDTLLCYFDCQYNIARTSEKLGVHINTIRQRLETLRDITGGWDDPVIALEMHVALRLDAIISNE